MTQVLLGGIERRKRTRLDLLEVFLASLRAHGPDLEVVLFNRSPDDLPLSTLLSRYRVESLPTTYPGVEIEIARFLLAQEWLQAHPVDHVLITDVLDVVFQDALPSPREAISIYEENNLVGACPYNSKWLQETFPGNWDDLALEPIVCCGVIGGTRDALLAYLSWYRVLFHHGRKRGFDSAVLNRFRGSRYVFPYGNPECMHLGYAPPDSVSLSADGVVTVDGWTPAIVHQYNRHPDVTKGLVSRWT